MTPRRRAPGAQARRSLWHLVPELAHLLLAVRLRPADLPALVALAPPSRGDGRGLGRRGERDRHDAPVRLRRCGLTLAGLGLWAARRAGEAPVLIDADGVVTGTELLHLVARRADALRGAGAVLVRGEDDRHLVATLLAAGTVHVDVVLLGRRAGAEELAAAQAYVEELTTRRSGSRGARREIPAVVLHSSGTTGRPSPRTQRAAGLAQLPTVVSLTAAFGARRGETMLVAAPLGHGHGLSALAAGLLLGAPVLLGAAARPDRGLGAMAEHRVRTWVGLPTQLADLLAAAGLGPTGSGIAGPATSGATGGPAGPATPGATGGPGATLAGLRRIVTGSAPLPVELVAQVRRAAGEVLVSYYGTTETGTATIARPEDLAAEPATAGRPATGVSVQIRDRAGRLAPLGQVGRVVLRSPWRAPGEPEWVATGDRGRLEGSGHLVLVGRTDDAVLVGGHVVSRGAVAAWLRSRPEVQEVQVRAVPDRRLGSVLEARVRATGSLAALQAAAREALGDAAAPRRLLPW